MRCHLCWGPVSGALGTFRELPNNEEACNDVSALWSQLNNYLITQFLKTYKHHNVCSV